MHAITCVVVIKRIELFFYWHENIFAKRQIHMTEQKQIMLRQQRELISFSSVVPPVSDFCFPAISSLNISWTINVIHTHHSQWHLHRCRERERKKIPYARILHSRFVSETLSFCAAVKLNDTISRYHLSGYFNLSKRCVNMYKNSEINIWNVVFK